MIRFFFLSVIANIRYRLRQPDNRFRDLSFSDIVIPAQYYDKGKGGGGGVTQTLCDLLHVHAKHFLKI